MNYTFNVPINNLSFGSVSLNILRESYAAGHSPCIIPIGGQVDISAQKEDKDFFNWLQSCLNKGLKSHKRSFPVLKLWHLSGGIESLSNKQVLYTFHELDGVTPEEINAVQNNHKVLFACDYNTNTFKDYGCTNVETVPLGFDNINFYNTNKEYFNDGRISFFIGGKWEPVRKRTDKVIQAWIKKFGNNKKYFLNCAIQNNFVNPEQHNQIYSNITKGQRYGNVQFLGFMPRNDIYNDFINSHEIVLGLGTESWGIPEFTATALGKHSIISNYAGHKQWANNDNSVLVNPCAKIPAYDNMFFHPNQPFNQGSVYDFNEDELVNAFELAIKRVEANKVNIAGLELQKEFTYKKTFDKIYQLLSE
jgi:hypothetical protein